MSKHLKASSTQVNDHKQLNRLTWERQQKPWMLSFQPYKLSGVQQPLCWLGCTLHDINANGATGFQLSVCICLPERKKERCRERHRLRGSERIKRVHEARGWRMSGQRRTTRETMERPESPEAFPKAHWFFEWVSATPHVRPKPLQSPGFSVGAEKKGIEKKRERTKESNGGRECVRKGRKRDMCCCADGWNFTSLAARWIPDFWSEGGLWIHIVDMMNAIIHVITPSGLRQAGNVWKDFSDECGL